jgi:Helix-hairpin-helix motif
MTALRKICLLGAAALLVVAAGSTSYAQLREQPELLRRLWPFGQVHRPVPLLPESTEAAPDEKRPLVAPFVVSKVNINTCSLAELQNLPGVNAAMGAHILAGRPYRNFDDLERDGVPLNVISQFRKSITFGPRP